MAGCSGILEVRTRRCSGLFERGYARNWAAGAV